jgi:hypothetical protein
MTSQNLEIVEYNEAGSLVATYITAASRFQNVGVEKLTERVDVVVGVNFVLYENKLAHFRRLI